MTCSRRSLPNFRNCLESNPDLMVVIASRASFETRTGTSKIHDNCRFSNAAKARLGFETTSISVVSHAVVELTRSGIGENSPRAFEFRRIRLGAFDRCENETKLRHLVRA